MFHSRSDYSPVLTKTYRSEGKEELEYLNASSTELQYATTDWIKEKQVAMKHSNIV